MDKISCEECKAEFGPECGLEADGNCPKDAEPTLCDVCHVTVTTDDDLYDFSPNGIGTCCTICLAKADEWECDVTDIRFDSREKGLGYYQQSKRLQVVHGLTEIDLVKEMITGWKAYTGIGDGGPEDHKFVLEISLSDGPAARIMDLLFHGSEDALRVNGSIFLLGGFGALHNASAPIQSVESEPDRGEGE